MEGFLLYVFLMSIVLLIVAKLVPGIEVESYGNAVLAAFGLGVLNALVKPLLIILTLPITLLTLGVFLLVINALLLQLCSAVVPSFHVKSFTAAFLASFVLAVLSFGVVSDRLIATDRNKQHQFEANHDWTCNGKAPSTPSLPGWAPLRRRQGWAIPFSRPGRPSARA